MVAGVVEYGRNALQIVSVITLNRTTMYCDMGKSKIATLVFAVVFLLHWRISNQFLQGMELTFFGAGECCGTL
jgi:hypothetical protein